MEQRRCVYRKQTAVCSSTQESEWDIWPSNKQLPVPVQWHSLKLTKTFHFLKIRDVVRVSRPHWLSVIRETSKNSRALRMNILEANSDTSNLVSVVILIFLEHSVFFQFHLLMHKISEDEINTRHLHKQGQGQCRGFRVPHTESIIRSPLYCISNFMGYFPI